MATSVTVDELVVLINAQTDDFKRQVAAINDQLEGLSRKTKSSSLKMGAAMGAAAGVVQTVVSKAMQAVGDEVSGAIQRFDTIQNFPRVMQNFGIGAKQAAQAMNLLVAGVKGLPAPLNDVTNLAEGFVPMTHNIGSAAELSIALAHAMAAGGQSMDIQSAAMEQFRQALAKGVPQLQDWRSVEMAMPAQIQQIAKYLGLGSGALSKYTANGMGLYQSMQDGAVSMSDFANALVTLDKKGDGVLPSFEKQAKNASFGVGTSITVLKQTIQNAMVSIMNMIGQVNIAAFFNGISSAIQATVPYIIVFIKLIAQAVGFVASSIGSLFGSGAKQSKKTADNTSKVSKSVQTAAASAGGLADNMGDAAKNAKTINNQLAGFDEMNVLQNPKGSSPAGANAGGGDINIPNLDGVTDESQKSANKVQKILDQLKKAWSAFANSSFGKGFVTIFKDIGTAIKWVIDKVLSWSGWSTAAKNIKSLGDAFGVILKNSAVKDILKAVAAILGAMTAALLIGISTWGLWSAAVAIATAISNAFDIAAISMMVAMDSVSLPIILVVAAIALLVVGIVELVKHWNTVKDIAGSVWDGIVAIWNGIADWFKQNVTDPVRDLFSQLWKDIKGAFNTTVSWFQDLFKGVWTAIKDVFKVEKGWITDFFKGEWQGVVNIWNDAGKFFGNVWKDIKTAFNDVSGWFGSAFNDAYKGVRSAFNGIVGFFSGLWNQIKGVFTNIGDKVGTAVGGAFKSVLNTVLGWIQDRINNFISSINGIIGTIDKFTPGSLPRVGAISLPRFEAGGVVPPGYPNDSYLARLTSGEVILNADQQRQLTNGRGTPVNVQIDGKTLLSFVIDGINNRSFLTNSNAIDF